MLTSIVSTLTWVLQKFARVLWQPLLKIYARLSPWVDKQIEKLPATQHLHQGDFAADARWLLAEQHPHGMRTVIWAAVVLLAVALSWAALADIDEVARGEGKVIPSKQVQVIQSLDGGIVSEIHTQVGEMVSAGEILLKVDPTRFVSNLRENHAQYLVLQTKSARLQAVAEGKPFVPPPEAEKEIPEVVAQEQILYASKRAELDAQLGGARQQLTQRMQELTETLARREQATRGLELTQQELDITRPLAKSGAVSDVDILRLERDVNRFRGERDMSAAQVPRMQAAIAESQRKAQEIELNFRNQARSELSEANVRLQQLSEGSVALADRVKLAEIRSPVKGTVKQLMANTVGGVVQPGKDLIEIVPADDTLLLEAKVSPRDIAFLRPRQKALVRFTAYDFAVYGGLEGVVENISADTIVDEKGNAFYLIRVRTTQSALSEKTMPIIPGMVAEVDVLTGKKSVLGYLLKPVLRAKERALRER